MKLQEGVVCLLLLLCAAVFGEAAESTVSDSKKTAPDLILHNGKVVTVDTNFSIVEAIAVRGEKIIQAGSNREVIAHKGATTKMIDLKGKMVLPGLIDSHTHAADASLHEFDHPIPNMEKITDVLQYIRDRAKKLPEGEWIVVRQVFITRLKEQRYPTRTELDSAAPAHPVLFATGPDASLNTMAMKLSGIDRDFVVTDGGSGFAEKDSRTGEPTGILRNATRYVKAKQSGRSPSLLHKVEQLDALFQDYLSVGITSICDRDAGSDDIEIYEELRKTRGLGVRVNLSHHIDSIGELPQIEMAIRNVAKHPLFTQKADDLRIIGIKTFLDGGMLTGSALMREPWGVSKIYSITDPRYRGVRFIPQDRLETMVAAAVASGLQFTAHAVGDGAVHALLDAYEVVNAQRPLAGTYPSISHSNFMSREAVEKAARLGVAVDIQPAWLYHDAHTLTAHFGYERMRYFQPLRSLFDAGAIAGGGSDHMQKIGSYRSVNVYNPFLGMSTAITRKGKHHRKALHPEEALTREQAIRFYTINNSRLLGRHDQLGSIEPGKLADFIVLDTDLLKCQESKISKAKVLNTFIAGRQVYPPGK